MTTDPRDSAPTRSDAPIAEGEVHLHRTGVRTYEAVNARGARIAIGKTPDAAEFSPGELLKAALGGCAGLSMDIPASSRLGEDMEATIVVSGDIDEAEDRYRALAETIRLDLAGLPDERRDRLVSVIERTIAAACTIERTVTAGVEVTHDIRDRTAG